VSPKLSSRQVEQWTSVSPWRLAAEAAEAEANERSRGAERAATRGREELEDMRRREREELEAGGCLRMGTRPTLNDLILLLLIRASV